MTFLIKLFAFAALSLVIGIGSAWYVIDNGAFFVTHTAGPWKSWQNEGRLEADPYTRAHMARSGRLPVTAATAFYFTATRDSDGHKLNGECDYEIAGRPFNALWWSIAAYDSKGQVIPNKADRHSFNSKNIALLPDGSFRIRLAPKARPGNWLPTRDDKRILLLLRVIKPLNASDTESGMPKAHLLPVIKRVDC